MVELFDLLLNIDKALGHLTAQYGVWVYWVLFLIIFGETGFVILPFLPGDSLLFIAGTISAGEGNALSPWLLSVLLSVAAILGNTVNYWVGRALGQRVFTMNIRFLDKTALQKTHNFYDKHGGKTIVLARFVPLFRTFAPFVAGMAQMPFVRFQLFNVLGALLWIWGLVFGGYFFGGLPLIRDHLNTIVLLGILAAILPLVLAGLYKFVKQKLG